jgi:hypothetical protein
MIFGLLLFATVLGHISNCANPFRYKYLHSTAENKCFIVNEYMSSYIEKKNRVTYLGSPFEQHLCWQQYLKCVPKQWQTTKAQISS